jgi:hypothetical protein
MPCVGLELTIPTFERGKTVHALDRSATVTGAKIIYTYKVTCKHIHIYINKKYECTYIHSSQVHYIKEGKAIPITGRGVQ